MDSPNPAPTDPRRRMALVAAGLLASARPRTAASTARA